MLDWILSMFFYECLKKLQCVVVGERDANKYGWGVQKIAKALVSHILWAQQITTQYSEINACNMGSF